MKLAIIAPDGLSTVLYATSFATVLGRLCDRLITISSIDGYAEDIRALGSQHISLEMARYISPVRDLKYAIQLFFILRRLRPDAVLTYTHKPNMLGILAAWLARVPVRVAAVRGMGAVFERRRGVGGWLTQWAIVWLYRCAGWAAHLIWFTNSTDRSAFRQLRIGQAERVVQTANAITLAVYSPELVSQQRSQELRQEFRIAADDVVVVMVGRLLRSKGILEFTEAASLVRRTHPNCRFLLIAPEERGALDEISPDEIRRREADGSFQWLGFRRDLRDIYSIVDIAVLPSWYQEGGYPRALLEPMAFAKPVIAADTDTCRNPVEVGRNGFLVKPQDGPELARTIEILLRDPDLRKRFGARSRQKILEEFDDIAVASVIRNRICSLLSYTSRSRATREAA